MSLAEKLKKISQNSKEEIPENIRKKMVKATAELKDSGIADKALKEGDSIVPFELPDNKGELVSSTDLLNYGPLVLTFYRGVW